MVRVYLRRSLLESSSAGVRSPAARPLGWGQEALEWVVEAGCQRAGPRAVGGFVPRRQARFGFACWAGEALEPRGTHGLLVGLTQRW